MKRFRVFATTIFVLLTVFDSQVSACPLCRAQVENGIYDRDFWDNLFAMLLPIIVITAIGFGVYHTDKISDRLKGGIK
jgi:hypothetical protein